MTKVKARTGRVVVNTLRASGEKAREVFEGIQGARAAYGSRPNILLVLDFLQANDHLDSVSAQMLGTSFSIEWERR